MKVKLMCSTPIDVAYFSAKTCYSKSSPIEMVEKDEKSVEDKIKFIKNILETGHESTIEGLNFTFLIEGVSRSLLAQITRHRIGVQFSVQSQRYVEYSESNYNIYTPPTIEKNEKAKKIYENIQKECFKKYKELLELGVPAEDSRYVLTNATCTNITMTINLRALKHLMGLRLCSRASLEIRELMRLMRKEVLKKEEWLEEFLQSDCIQRGGICYEKKSCGRKPTIKEILNGSK